LCLHLLKGVDKDLTACFIISTIISKSPKTRSCLDVVLREQLITQSPDADEVTG